MTEETPKSESPKPSQPVARHIISGAKDAADKATTLADSANTAFSAVKWVAIAVVFACLTAGGYGIYKVASAPAKAIGNAAENMSDAVKSGVSSVRNGTNDLLGRLVIPASDPSRMNAALEAAFTALTDMAVSEPDGMKARAFRLRHFPGHEDRVCALSMRFEDGAIPVYMAADNKSYATARSLGSKTDRTLRILIRAQGDDLAFNAEWDDTTESWVIKWKASTLKKPLGNADVEARLLKILDMAISTCQ